MKILVTGANGQLGLCLLDQLKHSQHDVEYLNKNDLDICIESQLRTHIKKLKPEIIINCAAYTQVDKSEDESKLANLVNNISVKNLAEISKEFNIKLIHISTDYVFDGTKNTPYSEKDVCNPINKYGETKYLGEEQIIKSECHYLIIRTSWVFSEYKTNFVKTMLELGEKNKTLKIIDDQLGSPTYAGDIAKFIRHIIESDYIDNSIINFSGDIATTWYGFAKKIFEVAKDYSLKTPIELIPARTEDFNFNAKRPKLSVLSSQLLKKKYKINPSNWQQGLHKVIKIYKKNK